MDSNTHSALPPQPPRSEERERPNGLAGLPAVVEGLAAEDLDRLSDAEPAEDILERQRQADRRHGQWLRRLAALDALDACGAAGADQGQLTPSTASWLRMGPGAARSTVRTARACSVAPVPRPPTPCPAARS